MCGSKGSPRTTGGASSTSSSPRVLHPGRARRSAGSSWSTRTASSARCSTRAADASSARARGAEWPAEPEPERQKRLAALAEAHQASWVVAAEVGALDEVMERFGARAQRGDDLVAQSLSLVQIVRELMIEERIEGWPRRLKNIPAPTQPMVRRAIDALCKEGRAIALGVFKDGELWTALVVRAARAASISSADPTSCAPRWDSCPATGGATTGTSSPRSRTSTRRSLSGASASSTCSAIAGR